jgi:hypothetical protein
MSFLKLVIFYFLEKWKKIFTGGIFEFFKKMGKTPIEIFEDLCLPYSDAALSKVTVSR